MRTTIALGTALLLCTVAACGPKTTKPKAPHDTFATPKEAADALVQACRTGDLAAVHVILGSSEPPLFASGDPARDTARCKRLVDAADQMMRLDPWRQGAVLVVGVDDYPVPVPLVQDASGWRFDAAAGQQEILRRRVGEDELTAIATCRAWAERGGDAPKHAYGYAYRVVGTRQRPTLIAYPSAHGLTGVYTFQVARKGRVYEKDLGPETATAATALLAGHDDTWKATWD
ncbi:MAG: DUF2950 family protein [bacterium]|nr:DUF2950 family protein [bacterium]